MLTGAHSGPKVYLMVINIKPAKKSSKVVCPVCEGRNGKHEPRLIAGLVLDCRLAPKAVK